MHTQLYQQVVFLRSVPDNHKTLLLSACTAVLYTPQHEHFGIVPLEAMAWGKAVVACDSGGPKESVVLGRTGLLCEPTAAAFADAMRQLLVRGVAWATRCPVGKTRWCTGPAGGNQDGPGGAGARVVEFQQGDVWGEAA